MSTLDLTIFLVCCAAFIFCLAMVVRSYLVLDYRIRANHLSFHLQDSSPYDDGPTYTEMMWDLRKWTFKQFYPELARQS